MPTKEVPVVIDFESPEYDAQFGDAQRADLLQGVLDYVLTRADEGINSSAARRSVIEDAVDSVLESSLVAIDMLYVERDDQAVTQTSLIHGSWEPEPEPEPCARDTWVRASIPESQQPRQSFMLNEFLRQSGGPLGRAPSMRRDGSMRRNASMARSVSGLNGGSPSGLRDSGGSITAGGGAEGAGEEGTSGASGTGGAGGRGGRGSRSPLKAAASPTKALSPEEAAAEARLREELEIRKHQIALAKSMDAKDAEAKAKLATISKNLKGRDYAYDHQGRIVPLASFAAERAPELLAPAGYAVKAPDAGAGNGRQMRRGLSKSPTRKKGTSSGTAASPGSAGERKLVNDFREAPARTQPSALETMAPTSGVTLRQGTQSKVGPRKAPITGIGMSREELARYAARRQAQGLAASPPPTGTSRTQSQSQSPAVGLDGTEPRGGTPLISRQSQPQQPQSAGAEGGGDAQQGAAGGSDSPRQPGLGGLLAALPDSQPVTAGARPKGGTAGSNAGGIDMGGAGTAGPLHPKPRTPDVNPVLVSAPDWGHSSGTGRGTIHPALAVAKPNDKAWGAEVGRTVRLPRDRASQATVSPPLSPSKVPPHVPQPLMTFV